MSHVTVHKQVIKNIGFFLDICEQRGHEVTKGEQTVRLFGSNAVQCVGSIHIKEWRYPIAITADGELKYDNFGSQPNSMEILGLTIQDYNVQSLMEAIPYDEVESVHQETLENGDIRVVMDY